MFHVAFENINRLTFVSNLDFGLFGNAPVSVIQYVKSALFGDIGRSTKLKMRPRFDSLVVQQFTVLQR